MMTRRFVLGAALATALLLPRFARAHEGHAHKIMGTVAMRHENHLQVKSTDGKAAEIALNEKTKIFRGKTTVKPDDIKAGERVVVTAIETKGKDGKTAMIATEVRLGTATKPAGKN
jgi:hypothetical protein